MEAPVIRSVPFVRISGIDRSQVKGSFAISVWADQDLVGVEPVFSRWHVGGCGNCQNSLHVTSYLPIPSIIAKDVDGAKKKRFAIKMLLSDERSIGKKQTDVSNVVSEPRLDVGELGMIAWSE